jgi:transposase
MRRIREILRLTAMGLSQRRVGRSLGIGGTSVWDCLSRAKAAGLSWPLDPALDDTALEARLYPPPGHTTRAMPDLRRVHDELRAKGMTLQLLWQEYKAAHRDDGYQYSQFCELYHEFEKKLDVVLRQEHRAGERMFVDFSGDGIPIVDRETGEITQAQMFVAVLGASNYTYVEVTPSQDLRSWIQAHIHAYEYFHGVPAITVPDQTKTAVITACRYEPGLNETYLEMARHYDTAIIPARPAHPRDKAKVEVAVLIAQRTIIAALRHHTFFSVAQANAAASEKREQLNDRKFHRLNTTRRELFEKLDKPALRPLPATRYEIGEWLRRRVNIDYHIEVEKRYYSVPYQLVHELVDVRLSASTVEIFRKSRRVASHPRRIDQSHSTQHEHMPKSHQKHSEWTPSRITHWAEKTGGHTKELVEKILASRPHPEQGYRSCLGLLRLGQQFGADRLEAACLRALHTRAHSYRSVQSILKTGLDRQGVVAGASQESAPIDHENIRGPDYYQPKEDECSTSKPETSSTS